MCRDVQECVKKGSAYQHRKLKWNKYGNLPSQMGCSNPLEVLMCGIIGSYTLKGDNNINCQFMCVIIVDPAMFTLEIEEIPT